MCLLLECDLTCSLDSAVSREKVLEIVREQAQGVRGVQAQHLSDLAVAARCVLKDSRCAEADVVLRMEAV